MRSELPKSGTPSHSFESSRQKQTIEQKRSKQEIVPQVVLDHNTVGELDLEAQAADSVACCSLTIGIEDKEPVLEPKP